MSSASSNGRVDILEWWKNSGYILSYTDDCIDEASIKGQIEVLEWWKNSGLKLKYTTYTTYTIVKKGDIKTLLWWKDSGLKIKFGIKCMDTASALGHVHILNLIKNYDHSLTNTIGKINDLKYNKQVIIGNIAIFNGKNKITNYPVSRFLSVSPDFEIFT